ncbi:MAG: hypothetical protein CM15mP51_24870 [Porticoccaceae bacterium]|nr:MAG: hypothetical protein CM15mP51_24870 [Porticoccaceae bacterium]
MSEIGKYQVLLHLQAIAFLAVNLFLKVFNPSPFFSDRFYIFQLFFRVLCLITIRNKEAFFGLSYFLSTNLFSVDYFVQRMVQIQIWGFRVRNPF